MVKVCGWHKRYFPDEVPPILGFFLGQGVSHGICRRCSARFDAELETWESERGPCRISEAAVDRWLEDNERPQAA